MNEYLCNNNPVSYTHLDVYKRQLLHLSSLKKLRVRLIYSSKEDLRKWSLLLTTLKNIMLVEYRLEAEDKLFRYVMYLTYRINMMQHFKGAKQGK